MIEKGNTLIEVMVSLALFSLLFIYTLTINSVVIRQNFDNKLLKSETECLQALENIILNNCTYSYLSQFAGDSSYISSNQLSIDYLRNNNIVFSDYNDTAKLLPYARIDVIKYESILKVTIIYFKIDGKTLDAVFYKGDY